MKIFQPILLVLAACFVGITNAAFPTGSTPDPDRKLEGAEAEAEAERRAKLLQLVKDRGLDLSKPHSFLRGNWQEAGDQHHRRMCNWLTRAVNTFVEKASKMGKSIGNFVQNPSWQSMMSVAMTAAGEACIPPPYQLTWIAKRVGVKCCPGAKPYSVWYHFGSEQCMPDWYDPWG